MLNKKAQAGIVIALMIVAIIGIGFYLYKTGAVKYPTAPEQGRVVFAIKDKAADMGSISQVIITVDKVQAHSETQSWVDISTTSKTYDLIQLKTKGELAVIADGNIKAGSYDQIKLDVSKVTVVDSQGTHEAKLPSNELKINVDMQVDNNSTATATFDFIADESLHVTGNGKYIFAPVVKVQTRSNAQVNNKFNKGIEIKEGDIKSSHNIQNTK